MIEYFSRRGNFEDKVQAVKVGDLNIATTAAWCRGLLIPEKDAISHHSTSVAIQFFSFGRVVRAYLGDYVVWDPRQGFFKKTQSEFEAEFIPIPERETPDIQPVETDDPFEGMTRFSDD